VIIFDSDVSTNPSVAAARRELVAELKRQRARVSVVDLPALEGLDKTGFDDFVARRGPEAAFELIQKAKTEAVPLSKEEEVTLERLAALSTFEYDRVRKEEAEKLRIRQETLDREVTTRRPRHEKEAGSGRALDLTDHEPWPESVNGLSLVAELVTAVRRYVKLPPSADVAFALWVMWSWLIETFDIAPRLAILSPEKGCGKTLLLTFLFNLTPRPLMSSSITPSAIFRTIEAAHPTLLIDEADTFTQDNEALRGILNSGHTRASATIIRTVGDDFTPRAFSTWCPMALAAIGSLPSTVEDRSIILPMQRKAPGEQVETLPQSGKRAAALRQELHSLARKIKRWTVDHGPLLADLTPAMPEGLRDRAQDNWRPLLAIADMLGADWPERARNAATELSGGMVIERESTKVQLLRDIRFLFSIGERDRISSQALCDELALLEERPWADWKKGKPLTPVQLARLLRPFEITSQNLKMPSDNSDKKVLKGYFLEKLSEVFARYLPPPALEKAVLIRYPATLQSGSGETSLLQTATDPLGSGSKNGPIAAPAAKSSGVADQNQDTGKGGGGLSQSNGGMASETLSPETLFDAIEIIDL
jgi:putative DNA primase/helicase